MSLFGLFGKRSASGEGRDKGGAPALVNPLPETPEDLTLAFQTDHTNWNNWAHAYYEAHDSFEAPEKAYSRLIAHYCGAEKQHQGITFGSDPSLDVERSELTGSSGEGTNCVVCVRHKGDFGFVSEYEFMFERDERRWRLKEVCYLDGDDGDRLPFL